MPKLKPGDKAPDFTLRDLQERDFRLYENLGGRKTIVLFYRGEWCPICNMYLTNCQQHLASLKENNAQIIAISTDGPAETQRMKERLGLSFTILPGLTKPIVKAYDLFYNEKFRHNEPAIFILLPDGTVGYAAILSGSLGRPSVEDLLEIAAHI